jgi:hypothetical protein
LPSSTFLSCAINAINASVPSKSPGISPKSTFIPIVRRCARTRLGASCEHRPRRWLSSKASAQPIATPSPCSSRSP